MFSSATTRASSRVPEASGSCDERSDETNDETEKQRAVGDSAAHALECSIETTDSSLNNDEDDEPDDQEKTASCGSAGESEDGSQSTADKKSNDENRYVTT